MYLLTRPTSDCNGPSPAYVQRSIDSAQALNDAVDRATAAIVGLDRRDDLNSRGLPIDPGNNFVADVYNRTPTRYRRVEMNEIPFCVRSNQPAALYHSRSAGLAGLSGAQVASTGRMTVTPRKNSYQIGDVVTLDFYGPPGWMVIQRNMWNGMDTGHNIDGTRGWGTYLDRVIGADGHYRLIQPMGLGNIGEWSWDFQIAVSDPADQLQGGDQHSGLKWMLIDGAPWNFSVQGDPRIPANQDFTAAFTKGGITSTDYRFYVSQHTGQSMDQVLIPQLMISNHMISDDHQSNYDRAVADQAIAENPWPNTRKNVDAAAYRFAQGVLDGEYHRLVDAGARLDYTSIVNANSPVWAAAEKVYRAGLVPIGAGGYQLRNAAGDYITYDMLNTGDPRAAGLKDLMDTGLNGRYQTMTTADAVAAVAALPAGKPKQELLETLAAIAGSGVVQSAAASTPAPGPQAPVIYSASSQAASGSAATGSIPVSLFTLSNLPASVTATLDSYTPAALPAVLKNDVAGIPAWMLAAGALGLIFVLKK